MTTQEMVNELAAELGNRTDLTVAPYTRYITWLNWALLDICGMHRKRAHAPRWFKTLERSTLFKLPYNERLVSALPSTTTLTLDAADRVAPANVDDYSNDCVLYFGTTAPAALQEKTYLIVDYDALSGVVTVDSAFAASPVPATTKYAILRRRIDFEDVILLNPNDAIFGVQRLEEALTGSALEQKPWFESVGTDFRTTGTPSTFMCRDSGIFMDVCSIEERWYRLWYYRYPTLLAGDVNGLQAECDLPEQWHEVVVLGAAWRGFESLMEPDRANQAHERYMQELTNKFDSYMIEQDHMDLSIKRRFS
jgi:hypothetical protein